MWNLSEWTRKGFSTEVESYAANAGCFAESAMPRILQELIKGSCAWKTQVQEKHWNWPVFAGHI
jgi:hypothetical protein